MAFPSYGFSSFGKNLATTESTYSGNNKNSNSTRPQELVKTNKKNVIIDSTIPKNTTSNRLPTIDNNQALQHQSTTQEVRKGLDTSIVSIESQHKEYTIYSPLKNLKNKELNNILDYETLLNKFYEKLVQNMKIHQINHLTLRQLINYDTKDLKTDVQYYNWIRKIADNQEILKINKGPLLYDVILLRWLGG